MKKFLAVILIGSMIWGSPVTVRKAEASFAVPIVALAAAALGVVLIAAWHSNSRVNLHVPAVDVGAKVDSATNIGRGLWMAYKGWNQYNQEQIYGKMVSAKVTLQALKDTVTKDDTARVTYPNLDNAIEDITPAVSLPTDAAGFQALVRNPTGGVYYKPGGGYCSLTSGPIYWQTGTSVPSSPFVPGQNVVTTYNNQTVIAMCLNGVQYSGPPWYSAGQTFANNTNFSSRTPPYYLAVYLPITNVTPSRSLKSDTVIRSNLIDTNGTSLKPVYASELDRLIAANENGYGVSIVDTDDAGTVGGAPPFILDWDHYPGIASPTDIDNPSVTGLGAGAVTGAQTQVDAAKAAQAAASAAAAAAAAAYAANPTAENKAALDQANADLAAANANLTAAANTLSQAQAGADTAFPNASTDTLKKFKWDKLKNLNNKLSNIFPFNLLAAIPPLIGLLRGDPLPPVFDVTVFDNTLHVDMGPFDPIAIIVRWMLAATLTIGVIFYIIEFYRGKG